MNLRSFLTLAVGAAALLALRADASAKYAKKIPNGSNVAGVTAVGHTDPDSGGATNAFGKAFAAADYTWTKDLCQADTDGDGQTNGEELGDPCCVWKEGEAPAVAAGAKDPGNGKAMLDEAALKTTRALCAAATAPTEAPAATDAPGTVKPAEGAAGSGSAAAPAATDAATADPAVVAGSGSDEWVWVPLEEASGSSTPEAGSATTPGASGSTPSSTPSASAAISTATTTCAAAAVGALALALHQL